jgi:hypothetical protein
MERTNIIPHAMAKKALLRLKMWFDPSFEGSPYETENPLQYKKSGKTGLFMSRRLMIRL